VTDPSQVSAGAAERAKLVRDSLPANGLFADLTWRIAVEPFRLGPELARELETLGRVLLKFYQATNLLYRQSVEEKQPAWVAALLDAGKPESLIALQRSVAFRHDVPRVIRPDILLTEDGFSITELDSVPGGIGLTAWLNQVYANTEPGMRNAEPLGGATGMVEGFASIFGDAPNVHIVVSEEAGTYRPEMEWLVGQLARDGGATFDVQPSTFAAFDEGDAVYRFFELFDLENVPAHQKMFGLAAEGRIRLTPPPKPMFEEKALFGLLWNRNLREFWHAQLGEGFFRRLQAHVPYTWVVDPAPLPPHGAIPELNLTDWEQLKTLSQKQRDLILKVSGFSPVAWGSRGVILGSDLSGADWAAAVDRAVREFPVSPWILQPYNRPRTVEASWFDFERKAVTPMKGRVRLCPYYFVKGDSNSARAELAGVLATICPADKKIIHGMKDAILAPCTAAAPDAS